jgi:hypothetical protein
MIMEEYKEIRDILREIAISQKELQASQIELQASQKDTAARFKETDAKFKDTDAKFKDTDAKFKDTDAKFKETDSRFKDTDVRIKETSRIVGGIGEKFGSFTEGLAYPSLQKILQKNYGIDNTSANVLKRFPNGSQIELDAFGYTNGSINNAVVVEVKSHLRSEHIYKFTDLLKNFRISFPEYKEKHLFGIIATVRNVSKELREELFEAGIELAIVHDDIFDLERNPKALDWNLV